MLHRRRSRRWFLQKAAPHPVSPSPTFTTACAIEPSLSLHYVRSRDSLADIVTEACKIDAFTALRSNLMGNTSYHLTYYPLKRFPHDRGGVLEGQPSLLI